MSGRGTTGWVSAFALAAALSAPAGAADLRPPSPARYAPARYLPPPIWTGFYVGAHFGGAFSGEDITGFIGTPLTFSTNPSGFIGGLQAGYDYQFAPNWLVGAELALSWTSASGNFNFITMTPAGPVASGTFNSNHNWYDTFTGRVGYVINDWMVLYAKGGAAWINADYSLAASGPFGGGSVNDTRGGIAVGLGAEWMFAPGWSGKLEYAFLDFSDGNFFGATASTQVHEIKIGANYHLAPGTLVGGF